MATTKHKGVRDSVAALFTGILPAAQIFANRDRRLGETGYAAAIHVYRIRSEPDLVTLGLGAPIDWTTEIRVVIKAREEGDSAEDIADDLLCSCYAALMADQSLGGLCEQMTPGEITWDQEEGETPVAVATFDVSITHRTSNNSISS